MGKNNSHTGYRNNDNGRFARKSIAENNPKKYTKEAIPDAGHGDTGRYDKKKK